MENVKETIRANLCAAATLNSLAVSVNTRRVKNQTAEVLEGLKLVRNALQNTNVEITADAVTTNGAGAYMMTLKSRVQSNDFGVVVNPQFIFCPLLAVFVCSNKISNHKHILNNGLILSLRNILFRIVEPSSSKKNDQIDESSYDRDTEKMSHSA